MELVVLLFLFFVSVSFGFLTEEEECNRYFGPSGSNDCVLLKPYYSKHQWATCITDQYMKTYSKGKHVCRDESTYCWYQCMLEIHDLSEVSFGFLTEEEECNRYFGPSGSNDCVLLKPYYSKHQWATCITDQYMKTYSKGKHVCRDESTYCWYQCMLEIHDLSEGPVYDDCACGPDAPTGGTPQPTVMMNVIPEWCFSPSGTECNWYRDCLEKRYPCKGTGNSYTLDYADKFCNVYEQHYREFDNIGQQWIDGVRKCLQVNLVPILRPFIKNTCEQIRQMAFDSNLKCYLNPDNGKPSICDIGLGNWARIFWTVKSAVTQAPVATFKQMIDVAGSCYSELLLDGMSLIQLKITKAKNFTQEQLEELSEKVSKTLLEKMGWIKKGILHFGYPSRENQERKKRSTNNTDENTFYINILLAESSQFDLNDENRPVANVTAAAIDVAEAIEKGDVRLYVYEGMKFTELNVCVDYNCTEASMQVEPAPPEDPDDGGLTVMIVVIILCVASFAAVLIAVSVVVLQKMRSQQVFRVCCERCATVDVLLQK